MEILVLISVYLFLVNTHQYLGAIEQKNFYYNDDGCIHSKLTFHTWQKHDNFVILCLTVALLSRNLHFNLDMTIH